MKVSQIYHNDIQTIHQDNTISEAITLIHNKHYNGLIVIDDNDKVVGVLSVQDIAGAVIPPSFQENTSMASAMFKEGFFQEQCSVIKVKHVKDLMRTQFIRVTLESSLMEVCADFLKNDLYIVPVFDEKKSIIGIITRSEIKKILYKCMTEPSE
jgi:predicted transcriptional regulator